MENGVSTFLKGYCFALPCGDFSILVSKRNEDFILEYFSYSIVLHNSIDIYIASTQLDYLNEKLMLKRERQIEY